MSRRSIATLVSVALLGVGPVALAAPDDGDPPGPAVAGDVLPTGQDQALVRLELPDRAALDRLVQDGADIAAVPAESPESRGGRVLVDLVVTGAGLEDLLADGAQVLQVIQHEGEGTANFEASRTAAKQSRARGLTTMTIQGRTQQVDTLTFDNAHFWDSKGQTFLQVQVTTSAVADPDLQIEVRWETADGTTGTFPLYRYVDAGQYLFHYSAPVPVPDRVVKVTATSSEGATVEAVPAPWPGESSPPLPDGYQSDFINQYMTPAQINERIDRLAAQYPDLVDVITLPNPTHGYQRSAKALVGDQTRAAIVVESLEYGWEGWNGTRVRLLDPGAADQPLTASFADGTLDVNLATDADGALVSTTDEVVALINAELSEDFSAFVASGQGGRVMSAADARLDDGLQASHLRPQGQDVRALRIGKHRDGSRPGVYTYSQEHAREWATPLVTLEFAERMLANSVTDPQTGQLLEDVEIFVLPVVNPDGANYSFYDYNFQRKNMSDYCEGASRDPRNEDRWGVDVNRNYTVGSVFDGWVGGSLNCLSGTYAGTAELSEAEARNAMQIAEDFPNITHAINVHSYGGYFMWSPGAYKMPGRVALPYPDTEEEAEFLLAAQRIVGAISDHRGTVTWPSQTGPVIDVLYSAGGNSADQLYYDYGIAAWDFEVGNDLWDETSQQWRGVGFQPPYEEAHAESQEYAAGLVELVRVAADAAASAAPVTRLEGADRYGTAVKIGRETFPDSQTVVLVSGADASLVDGLVAAPLAYGVQAPLLSVKPGTVPDVVLGDLTARGVTKAWVVGGEAAVSEDVLAQLRDLDIEVTRVAGANRYSTATEVADLVGGDEAVIASGQEGRLVDALAASGGAASQNTPILLVRQDRIPDPTAAELADYGSTLVVGGETAISDDVVAALPAPVRLQGANRWETATAIADHYAGEGLDVESVTVASGEDDHLVDALPGGTLAEAILLSRVGRLPAATSQWLENSNATSHAYLLGGQAAVSEEVKLVLEGILAPR